MLLNEGIGEYEIRQYEQVCYLPMQLVPTKTKMAPSESQYYATTTRYLVLTCGFVPAYGPTAAPTAP
eukprot:451233-Rhodomonas_salina.1